MIEEKYMKQLKKLEDELFPRIEIPHIKIGITKQKFTEEIYMCPSLEDLKILIPFNNGKNLDYLDVTYASGTKIKLNKKKDEKVDKHILKIRLNGNLLTETYKWIEKCFNNKRFYEPIYIVPVQGSYTVASPQYSSKCLLGVTDIYYPIESDKAQSNGIRKYEFGHEEFDWWIEEPNESRKYFPDEISLLNDFAASH